MEQILPGNWAFMLFGLIFSITCAQMLVVYVLADSSKPPAGLGLFTALKPHLLEEDLTHLCGRLHVEGMAR